MCTEPLPSLPSVNEGHGSNTACLIPDRDRMSVGDDQGCNTVIDQFGEQMSNYGGWEDALTILHPSASLIFVVDAGSSNQGLILTVHQIETNFGRNFFSFCSSVPAPCPPINHDPSILRAAISLH